MIKLKDLLNLNEQRAAAAIDQAKRNIKRGVQGAVDSVANTASNIGDLVRVNKATKNPDFANAKIEPGLSALKKYSVTGIRNLENALEKYEQGRLDLKDMIAIFNDISDYVTSEAWTKHVKDAKKPKLNFYFRKGKLEVVETPAEPTVMTPGQYTTPMEEGRKMFLPDQAKFDQAAYGTLNSTMTNYIQSIKSDLKSRVPKAQDIKITPISINIVSSTSNVPSSFVGTPATAAQNIPLCEARSKSMQTAITQILKSAGCVGVDNCIAGGERHFKITNKANNPAGPKWDPVKYSDKEREKPAVQQDYEKDYAPYRYTRCEVAVRVSYFIKEDDQPEKESKEGYRWALSASFKQKIKRKKCFIFCRGFKVPPMFPTKKYEIIPCPWQNEIFKMSNMFDGSRGPDAYNKKKKKNR